MIFSAEVRSIWYSLSPKCLGRCNYDTVTGMNTNRIDILHITYSNTVSIALSRITSYSISFHPAMQRSTRTCPTRDKRSPFSRISTNCSSIMSDTTAASAEGISRTKYNRISDAHLQMRHHLLHFQRPVKLQHGSPIFSMVSLNSRRSSAFLIVSAVVPISLTLCSLRNPASSSSIARFSPACPPRVGSTLSGFSFKDQLFYNFYRKWFNINAVCNIFICHDRCRVRVQKYNFKSFFFQ